jgi:hypothetical protein
MIFILLKSGTARRTYTAATTRPRNSYSVTLIGQQASTRLRFAFVMSQPGEAGRPSCVSEPSPNLKRAASPGPREDVTATTTKAPPKKAKARKVHQPKLMRIEDFANEIETNEDGPGVYHESFYIGDKVIVTHKGVVGTYETEGLLRQKALLKNGQVFFAVETTPGWSWKDNKWYEEGQCRHWQPLAEPPGRTRQDPALGRIWSHTKI